ncbi:MAG: zinc-binding dehydrogenase [Candidatus Promineifilaceae bacterium]|nr:zinc-binding dehydrogenase [Candidatus Promineifilaceae bacterium]
MARDEIPAQMTAVVLESYDGLEAIHVGQRPVTRPGKDEVLVKVAASPINPSDLAFLEGLYGFKKPTPVVPGFEGSGTVVAVGGGSLGRNLYGKRVACVSQRQGDGVWAQYMVTRTSNALPLDESVSLEQGAMSVVNPLTAIALLDLAKARGHEAVVLTAAASTLGQMINRLGRSEGIQVINVVRRDEQVALLKRQGASIVLNSKDADFSQELRDVCHQNQAQLAYDAVAGPLTLQLLEAMPPNSKVTVFGGLSYKPVEANPGHLIFQDKAIDGFWLTTWLARKNFDELLLLWRRAQKLLLEELKSEIRTQYPLREIKKAIRSYQTDMTGGKVLLRPDH